MKISNSLVFATISVLGLATAVTELTQLSLVNLVTIESINDIAANWEPHGVAEYEEGRIILTPKPKVIATNDEGFEYGALWTSKGSSNLNSFTTELTLRSLGGVGYTDAGISLFIVDEGVDVNDVSNFGGPSVFKGVQVVLNHDKVFGAGIRVYLNDGRKLDMSKDFIGAYLNEYQGSNVPMTLKVSYSDKFFKITSDNKLLFETDQVNLSALLNGGVKIGVSAQSKKKFELNEQFEILRLVTYDSVTNEMKEQNDETLFAKHDQFLAQKQPIGKNFHEQEARLIEELKKGKGAVGGAVNHIIEQPASNQLNKELSVIRESMALLLTEVKATDQTAVRQQIFTLGKSIDRLALNFGQLQNQYSEVSGKLDELTSVFKKQFNLLDNYDSSLRSFDRVLKTQLESADNLDNKISTLFTQYSNDVNRNRNEEPRDDGFSKIKSLLYVILLPVVGLLILVVLWVHRLRNDIKHAKVL